MIGLVVLTFIDLFVTVFTVVLLVRVISSYIASPTGGFYTALVNVTEPVLAPVRRVLPNTPGIDLAPLAVFFLLQGVQILARRLFGA